MTDLIKRDDALALLDLIAGGEEYMADRERLVSALPAVTVGVKPLVWDESLKGRWIGTPFVKLGDLAFWVFHREDGTFMRATKDGGKLYPTLKAAKAAAQADYEARILAALTPTPAIDPAAIREAALREAANIVEVLKGMYEEGGSPTAGMVLGVALEDILALIGEEK